MQFNRTTCGVVERDVMAALKAVEEKHNIKIEREGGGRFTESSLTFKLKCSVVGEGGVDLTEKREFESSAVLFGFKPEHYNREFNSNGERYRLVGFNFRARRMPLKAVRVRDGASFKFADSTGGILAQLNKAA